VRAKKELSEEQERAKRGTRKSQARNKKEPSEELNKRVKKKERVRQ
jgi:hypothetical protein